MNVYIKFFNVGNKYLIFSKTTFSKKSEDPTTIHRRRDLLKGAKDGVRW